ncbi:MAG: ATP synthase F1 subunit gamma [Lentimicrobiaceae bacterium]|nr:ATP synthase F1 subunit gamma [Lentimicrobiaceae bacterium]
MANLKEIRTRIESVNSTKQITSAMKMVAASKLRKSQNAIMALRPYAEKFSEIMEAVSKSTSQRDNETTSSRDTEAQSRGVAKFFFQSSSLNNQQLERLLLIPISSNKGLCGVFNANVIRATINLIKEEYQELYDKGNVDILCIGAKVEESLKFKKYAVIGNKNELLDKLTYDNIVPFAEMLMQYYNEGKYDRIVFVYNQFKNAATQILVTEQFLPIRSLQVNESTSQQGNESMSRDMSHEIQDSDFIFQPNKEEILETMIPKSLKLQVYKILLDSFASEQGARMISMTQATDNATELLKELNLTYNKARQSAITNELVEIVSGANAINN